MAGFLDFLGGILNPDQQNRLAAVAQPSKNANRLLLLGGDDTPAGGGALDALGQRIMQQQLNPYMGGAAPVNAQPSTSPSGTASASTIQDDPASKSLSGSQSAATGRVGSASSASGQGFGGFLQNLFNPQQKGLNETVAWLQRKGYDAGAANYIAHNKDILRGVLNEHILGGKPNEYQQRAQALSQAGVDPNSAEGRRYFLTGNLPEAPKPYEPPDAVQTLEWRARAAGLQPGTSEYQNFMRVNGGGVTTNVNMPVDNEYDKTVGKGFGERFLDIQKDAQTAGKALNSLTVMDQAMNQPGFYSGTGSGAVQYAKRVAAALGLDPNGVSDMETFNAMTKSAALDSMGGSLGTGFSNADRDFVLDQVPNLSNSPEGNRQLIDIQRKLAQRKQQVAKLARDYAGKNNGRIDAGFDDYLSQWAEQNPIFPKLPARPAPANVTGPERVRNPETGRRPRARNPQTGQVIEWNGSQWEQVQ